MRIRASIALLFPLACLLGCTLPYTPSPTPADTWENWQIQAGSAITSPPNTYPSFLGAIQVQGTQATGIFTTVVAAGTTGQPLDYTGAFDSSTEDVTLATFGYGFGYTQPSTPYALVPVSVTGGCVYPPTYTGAECLAIFAVPSVGVQIAPLNGTYTGTLTGTLGTIGTTGLPRHIASLLASLTLTQSSTPNSSGQFPLNGSITFPSSSNLSTTTLAGTVSGEGIALANVPYANPVAGPTITLTASTDPAATQITVTNLDYTGPALGTPYATLTGTLTLQ